MSGGRRKGKKRFSEARLRGDEVMTQQSKASGPGWWKLRGRAIGVEISEAN